MPGYRLAHFPTLGSTSDQARVFAEQGQSGPLWVLADVQTGGRGRRGRSWVSPPGNLYATHLQTVDAEETASRFWTFAAAMAVHDVIASRVDPQRVVLKWPNDVLVDGAKISGILLESGRVGASLGFGAQAAQWVTTGIGINLRHAPAGLERATISLEQACGEVVTPLQALEWLDARYAHWRALLAQQGFAALAREWLARSVPAGTPMVLDQGGEVIEGRFAGLDPHGALLLAVPTGPVRAFHAGDVRLKAQG